MKNLPLTALSVVGAGHLLALLCHGGWAQAHAGQTEFKAPPRLAQELKHPLGFTLLFPADWDLETREGSYRIMSSGDQYSPYTLKVDAVPELIKAGDVPAIMARYMESLGSRFPAMTLQPMQLVDTAVGQVDSGKELVGLFGKCFVGILQFFGVLTLGDLFHIIPDSFYDQTAGHFSGLMSSHPVGHHIKPQVVIKVQSVFISRSFHTHIGDACRLNDNHD